MVVPVNFDWPLVYEIFEGVFPFTIESVLNVVVCKLIDVFLAILLIYNKNPFNNRKNICILVHVTI